jgi:hypothetical protein
MARFLTAEQKPLLFISYSTHIHEAHKLERIVTYTQSPTCTEGNVLNIGALKSRAFDSQAHYTYFTEGVFLLQKGSTCK